MAGTTIDEQNLVYKTLHHIIQESGYPVTFEQVLTHCAGKEKRQAIWDVLQTQQIAGNLSEITNQIFARFKVALAKAYQTEPIQLQPGASELFEILQKRAIKVVLNTGYDRPTTDQILQRIGYHQHPSLDLVVTASEVQNGRPHPDMILYAIEHLGIGDPQEVAKVGDSIIDIQEGQEAGCKYSIGITTGAHSYEQLQSAAPDAIIDGLSDLIPFLDGAAQ